VVSTASAHNFDYLRSLGAAATIDRNSPTAVDDLVAATRESPLVGSLAIGNGSLPKVMRVAARVPGTGRVSSAAPELVTRILALRAPRGVHASGIWGGTLKDNEVGPAIYTGFLPVALAAGAYRAEPQAEIVGHGLDAIPAGLQRLRNGVSAKYSASMPGPAGTSCTELGYPLMIAINAAVKGAGSRSPRIASCWL
jgi:hypothetical protein